MFCVQIIVFTATVGNSAIVLCCVGVHCGYSKSIYSAMVLCCLWSLLWLEQRVHIVHCYCVVC